MIKASIFTLTLLTAFTLQAMEKSSPKSPLAFKKDATTTEEIAIQLQEFVIKFAEQYSLQSSPYGFSSSTTLESKKYKEIKDSEGNYSKKTCGIGSTDIECGWEKVRILKSKKGNQTVYSLNIPFFEKPETIKTKIFDDNLDKNNLLRTFVSLIHQFQKQTQGLTEDASLDKYKIAVKQNTLDIIPSITGKVILPASPTVSPNISPVSSPPASPSSKTAVKVVKTFIEKQLMVENLTLQDKLKKSFTKQDKLREALNKH